MLDRATLLSVDSWVYSGVFEVWEEEEYFTVSVLDTVVDRLTKAFKKGVTDRQRSQLASAWEAYVIESDRHLDLFFKQHPFLEHPGEGLPVLPESEEQRECDVKCERMLTNIIKILDYQQKVPIEVGTRPTSQGFLDQTKIFEQDDL